ncbi:MAG TPA: glycosyl hydrolase, partial [Catenuloplanes sp.]
ESAATSTAQTRADTFTAEARYVRVTVTGLPPGTWASIVNFSVFSAATPGVQPFKGLAGGSCPLLDKLNVSWHYNWWIDPGDRGDPDDPNDCDEPGFVPTISGRKDMTAGDVEWHVDRVYDAGHTTLLGFNEPNKADQSNMTMAQVVDLWPTLTKDRGDQNLRVSSPSTSGDGKAWFEEFMKQAEAKELQVDFINLHWYGWNAGSCDANASTFEAYINWAESLPGNRPIWITEWGCLNQSAPDRATVERFYAAAVTMFARHPRIERQSFYPWIKNHELTEPTDTPGTLGPLTPLGQAFADTPAYR